MKLAPILISMRANRKSAAHDIRSKRVKEFRLCLHFDLVYSRERACQSNRIHLPVIRFILISTVFFFRKIITFDVASLFSFSRSQTYSAAVQIERKKSH